jgi:hypothetical protein
MIAPSAVTIGRTGGGNSDTVTIQIIPPNASLDSVDFYMRFNMTKKVPLGGKLTISHSTQSLFTNRAASVAKNYVFFSKGYASVEIATGAIVI